VVSFFVVFEHPVPGDFSDLVQIPEQPSVQNLVPIGPIETLNIGVLIRLSGFNVINENNAVLAPICEHPDTEVHLCIVHQIRKLTKTKGGFPNENSLLKLRYLGIQNASKKWTMPIQNWALTLSQLALFFEGRLDDALEL
jgi:hypothetical protein